MAEPTDPLTAPLSDEQQQRLQEASAQLRELWSLDEALAPYAGHRWTGEVGPTLHLEDVSDIPFVAGVPGVEEYQHRARVRASDGDIFAAVTAPARGYERYCREDLGLGQPDLLLAEPVPGRALAVAEACLSGASYTQLADWLRAREQMVIHPYMSIAHVWELAAQLERDTSRGIKIIGPPPPTLWIANDKSRLAQIVERSAGEDWLVETQRGADLRTMVRALRAIGQRHAQVALKRTRCASAMGNLVLNADELGEGLEQRLGAFLEHTEWDGAEEVLLVAWESTPCSPSTQLWLPPLGQGAPVVEGVYEQLLEGEERCFLGSRPSTLPASLNRRLAQGSLRVATVLQALGYTGRCSFDFIVPGDLDDPEVQPRLVECNGRWGGTSTPMFLVDRLVDGPRPQYIAQDFMDAQLEGLDFEELRQRLDAHGLLFDPESQQGRYILYNVGPLLGRGKFDVIALGGDSAQAAREALDALPQLLGL